MKSNRNKKPRLLQLLLVRILSHCSSLHINTPIGVQSEVVLQVRLGQQNQLAHHALVGGTVVGFCQDGGRFGGHFNYFRRHSVLTENLHFLLSVIQILAPSSVLSWQNSDQMYALETTALSTGIKDQLRGTAAPSLGELSEHLRLCGWSNFPLYC